MKLRRLLILLAAALAAAPAAGQTIKSLGYNTTNGFVTYSGTNSLTFTNALQFATNARAATRTNLGGTTVGNSVFTATNAAAAATAIGLGTTNAPIFSNIQLSVFGSGGSGGFAGRNAGGLFELYGTNLTTSEPAFYGFSGFVNTAFSAGEARTNLGLGATWLTNTDVTNFRTAIGLGATNNVTFNELTATGNVTMSGLNNTATAQTASSGASLMTRELTDNNPLWALGSVRPMGAYAFGNSGGTAQSAEFVTRGGAYVSTGTNTNGYGRASLYQGINDATALTGQGIRFTQSVTASAILSAVPRTNSVVRLVVGGNGGVPAAADANALAVRGFGVEFAVDPSGLKMRLFAHNGTSYTNSDYTAGIANSSQPPHHVIISSQTNGVISLYHAVAVVKSPPRPSTTPLLTLSGGPTSGVGGGFVDLVAVTASNAVATPISATALFYNGMVEVKD